MVCMNREGEREEIKRKYIWRSDAGDASLPVWETRAQVTQPSKSRRVKNVP